MKGTQISLILILVSFFYFFGESNSSLDDTDDNQVYIVYMGATDSTSGTLRAQILNTVLTRNGNALIHNYEHGFSGFAARLTKYQANSIAQHSGVLSVFPDPILKLHTTHSWDFLKSQSRAKINNKVSNSSVSSDVVIGLLDSGIRPESPSFSDKGFGPIPRHWKGICMTSDDFNSSSCNRKLIGARYFLPSQGTPESTVRDPVGHGTHTASTAVGANVPGASYYGLQSGIAIGGSPESRLSIYRVCNPNCYGSNILAAFDAAIHDGVDILSVSLGGLAVPNSDLTNDAIAIGAFHATEHGILVACSAGNDGPSPSSVTNDAPWIFTVGATTIDRDLQTNVVLGNKKVVKGKSISFPALSKSPNYPLITGESAVSVSGEPDEARQCHDSLDIAKVKGKIVICDGQTDDYPYSDKLLYIQELGGVGIIHISDEEGSVAFSHGDLPETMVKRKDATALFQYLNSTRKPVATILETITVGNYTPAPAVAFFSARGPSYLTKNIIKPDISAPGVNILASWIDNDADNTPVGKEPITFALSSGTSMSCPHVAGLAASIKSRNPTWSASAIKSAIITTATQINNLKAPITTDSGTVATPFDVGAGEITYDSFRPGLVYETSTIDYLNYLCYLGYTTTKIKLISSTVPKSFRCPKVSTSDQISNINYPSISVSDFIKKRNANVSRTVTNIGEEDDTIYSVVVDAPKEVKVQVIPQKLHFTKSNNKLNYQIIFSSTVTSLRKDLFGSITWTNGKYTVRSPFIINLDI